MTRRTARLHVKANRSRINAERPLVPESIVGRAISHSQFDHPILATGHTATHAYGFPAQNNDSFEAVSRCACEHAVVVVSQQGYAHDHADICVAACKRRRTPATVDEVA
eukprot:2055229-Pleurochrysis_carterae.AAC.3